MGSKTTDWKPLALLCTAIFMTMLDSSIVLVPLPSIDGEDDDTVICGDRVRRCGRSSAPVRYEEREQRDSNPRPPARQSYSGRSAPA
jgi:hypothetical protein